jgi:hypothetical protein
MSDDDTPGDLPPLELRPRRRVLPELELDLRRSGRRGNVAPVAQPVPEQSAPVDSSAPGEPVSRTQAKERKNSERLAAKRDKTERKAEERGLTRRTKRLLRKAAREREQATRKAAEQRRRDDERQRKESERLAAEQEKAQRKAAKRDKSSKEEPPASAADVAEPARAQKRAKPAVAAPVAATATAPIPAQLSTEAHDPPKPRKPPVYWRLLRLHHVQPNGWQRALLIEGVLAVAIVLVLAGKATVWTIPVLPVVAALLVKLNDVLAGTLAGAKAQRADTSSAAAKPAKSVKPAKEVKAKSAQPAVKKQRASAGNSAGAEDGKRRKR